MSNEQPIAYGFVEHLAIKLYHADGFTLMVYSSAEESWKADREDVRQRYLCKARVALTSSSAHAR